MTNVKAIYDAQEARDAFVRRMLTDVIKHNRPEDIVAILSEAISDEGYALAQRTGDYTRSSELLIMARYLERLEEFVDNFDSTEE